MPYLMVKFVCLYLNPFGCASPWDLTVIHLENRMSEQSNIIYFITISSLLISILKSHMWKINYFFGPVQWWNPFVCTYVPLKVRVLYIRPCCTPSPIEKRRFSQSISYHFFLNRCSSQTAWSILDWFISITVCFQGFHFSLKIL